MCNLLIRIFFFQTFFIFLGGCSAQEGSKISSLSDFDQKLVVIEPLPVYFDLRNTGRLSPVRTQPAGACWASATMSSVESFWRTSGFSEEVLSDINLKLFHGYDSVRNGYGNHFMATAYFTRGSGPLIKDPVTDSISSLHPELTALNTGARFLPDSAGLIKQTIMDFGAVWSMMYFRKELFDTVSNIWHTQVSKINHVINLIGWNDTLQTATGRGCWIAQNSLGKKFGEDGFFYIPYSDPNILQYNAVWPEWIPWDWNRGMCYYDTLGRTENYGFDDTVCYGLVKFSAPGDIIITGVGTHIGLPGTYIRTEIFQEFDTASKTLYGQVSASQAQQCRFAGYYSLELPQTVTFKKSEDFYVMMQYSHPSDTIPLPVERFIPDYADPDITANKCWVNPDFLKWPETWYPCGQDSPYRGLQFDLCIRVYFRKQ